MRLKILEHGHRPLQKIILSFIRTMSGGKVPGPILVMSYRRELFGKHLAACIQEAMRGATAWTVGEVELFAAFVSKQNACNYCVGDHTAVATLGLGDAAVVAAVLQDWRTAPVSEKVRATLGFLEKLIQSPDQVTSEDIAPLQAAGVSARAIEEALYVCFVFDVINRLADSFDFYLPDAQGFARDAQMLYRMGYGIASVPG